MILKTIIAIAGSDIGRIAIAKGATKLVQSTDSGIDDKMLAVFLDKAVASNRNRLTAHIKDELIGKLNKAE